MDASWTWLEQIITSQQTLVLDPEKITAWLSLDGAKILSTNIQRLYSEAEVSHAPTLIVVGGASVSRETSECPCSAV